MQSINPFVKDWEATHLSGKNSFVKSSKLHLWPALLARAGRFHCIYSQPFCQGLAGHFSVACKSVLIPVNQELANCLPKTPVASCVDMPLAVHVVGVDPHLPALIHNLLAVIKKYWDVVVFAVHSLALAPCFLPGESDLVKIFHQVLLLQLFQDHFWPPLATVTEKNQVVAMVLELLQGQDVSPVHLLAFCQGQVVVNGNSFVDLFLADPPVAIMEPCSGPAAWWSIILTRCFRLLGPFAFLGCLRCFTLWASGHPPDPLLARRIFLSLFPLGVGVLQHLLLGAGP